MHSIRELWERITEPKAQRIVYAIVYMVTFLTGVGTLWMPPNSIAGQLGPALTTFWSIFLILGGIVGLATVFSRWWKMERVGITLTLGGVAIYGTVVLYLHFTQPGSRITQLGMIILAALLFILRLILIQGRDFQPRSR